MCQIPFINTYSGILTKSLTEYKERKELGTYSIIAGNSFLLVQKGSLLYSDDVFVSSNELSFYFCRGVLDWFHCMIIGSLEGRVSSINYLMSCLNLTVGWKYIDNS